MLKVYNIKDKIEYLREVAILEHNEWAKDPQESFEDRINKKRTFSEVHLHLLVLSNFWGAFYPIKLRKNIKKHPE